jgi:alpha-amylase/alpha-mannosidase (GH57 family)
MKKVYLAFLWHQHQPIYKNPITGVYELPWVRLHATKDYYDMVAILDNYPKIKSNINFAPSLLMQLEEYASGKVKDKFLDITLKDANTLTEDEKAFILNNFFMANWDTMIAPYARYNELLEKRGKKDFNNNDNEIKNILKIFSVEDFRDLQVWFNLSWTDPYWRKNDDFIAYLYNKSRNFTEEDKNKLIQKHIEICGMVVKKHKELQDKGQIDVSVTPFYHPILPLLCDTNSALEATPKITLPSKRFSYPEDALWHINTATSYYEKLFGKKPLGMWPSEGSVSNTAVELISDAGLKWIATDEAVLFNSAKHLNGGDRRHLFKPFKLNINGKNLDIIFRDHGLSDSIGFVYSKWNPQDAANDFVNKIKNIGEYASSMCEAPLISVILDGDNCWEYYSNDGWDFLQALYERLSVESGIETVRISEYLQRFPPSDTLMNLTAGSWINGNFGVWIGHHEDNLSWEYLATTRDFIKNYFNEHQELKGTDVEKEVFKNLYIAQGSDWNWWYGDEHSSSSDAKFDYIYRQHLIKIYEILGQKVPAVFYKTIRSTQNRQDKIVKPQGFIYPKIDGNITDFFEWKNSGHYEIGHSGGSMHQISSVLKSFNFGFDIEKFYLKLDLNERDLSKPLEEYNFNLIFIRPVEVKIVLKFNNNKQIKNISIVYNGQESIAQSAIAKFENSIEFSIPFKNLNFPFNYDNIEFVVGVSEDSYEIERWPYQSSIKLPKPEENLCFLDWSL